MENMLNESLRGSWSFIHNMSQEGLQLAWKLLPSLSVTTVLLLLIAYAVFYTKVDLILSTYICSMFGFMGCLFLVNPTIGFALPILVIPQCVLGIVAEMLHRRIHSNLKLSIQRGDNKENGQ